MSKVNKITPTSFMLTEKDQKHLKNITEKESLSNKQALSKALALYSKILDAQASGKK